MGLAIKVQILYNGGKQTKKYMVKTKSTSKLKKRTVLGGKPLPTGQEIYDRLMQKIEPELMLKNLKKLDAPYKKETASARKKRYARYAKAFKTYKAQYKAWVAKLNLAIAAYKRAVVKASERVSKAKEDSALADLEAQMKAA